MAITTTQLNTIKAALFDLIIQQCPEADQTILRIAVNRYRNGTAAQKEAAQVIMQTWYQTRTGRNSASFPQNFRQEIRTAIQPQDPKFPATPAEVPALEPTTVT